MVDLPVTPAIEAGAKLQMVKVTNRNSFAMRDRFDGVPYDFKIGEPLSIPPQAAAHFFGWPGEADIMKAHTCKRFGWNRPEHIGATKGVAPGEQTLADLYWSNIAIETVNFCVVQEGDASSPMPDMGHEDDPMTDGNVIPRLDPTVPRVPRAEPNPETLTHVGQKRRPGRPRKVK
jgi:hypothetical protein